MKEILVRLPTPVCLGFPGGSGGEESTCNAGELGLIPGLGRCPGGGHGIMLPYGSMVKNLPVMWETWVQSLHWEDPLEKGTATHSSILAWKSSRTV